MMKKHTTSLLLLFFCVASLAAQNISTVIKTEAMEMAKTLSVMDLEGYSKYMYPTLVSDQSSKQRIIQGVDSIEKYRKQYGLKVKKILIGHPSPVITYKNVMQSTISQTTVVESVMGTISMESIMVALSNDGKKWYFVESRLFRQQEAKSKLPELSPELVIPKPKEPVFTQPSTSN